MRQYPSRSIDYFNNVVTKFIVITGQMHEKLTSIGFYDNKLGNCLLSLVDINHINYKSVSVCILTIKVTQMSVQKFLVILKH